MDGAGWGVTRGKGDKGKVGLLAFVFFHAVGSGTLYRALSEALLDSKSAALLHCFDAF